MFECGEMWDSCTPCQYYFGVCNHPKYKEWVDSLPEDHFIKIRYYDLKSKKL